MYKIEPTSYGFKVTSAGLFTMDEIALLWGDLITTLKSHNGPFSLFLDARKLVPPTPDVREEFVKLHTAVWQLPCRRVAFVVESPVAKGQIRQMHYSASPESHDRIFDATRLPDWEARALAWVVDGVETDDLSSTERLAIR